MSTIFDILAEQRIVDAIRLACQQDFNDVMDHPSEERALPPQERGEEGAAK